MGQEKGLDQLIFLDDISYFKEHTWAKFEDNKVIVGISDFAQNSLGEIIFIELPETGMVLSKGEEFGLAESAKVTSSLYMPISGEIIEVNSELEDAPEKVSEDPYGSGWIIGIKPNDLNELDELLSKDEYLKFLTEA